MADHFDDEDFDRTMDNDKEGGNDPLPIPTPIGENTIYLFIADLLKTRCDQTREAMKVLFDFYQKISDIEGKNPAVEPSDEIVKKQVVETISKLTDGFTKCMRMMDYLAVIKMDDLKEIDEIDLDDLKDIDDEG